MFCPKCGKELPDAAKFCAQCGNAILPNQNIPDTPAIVPSINDSQGNNSILQNKSSNNKKVIIGAIAIAIAIVMIAVIFIIRSNNEKDMIRQIPWIICDDETEDTITAYYKDYLGESLMVICNADAFKGQWGSDSNSFNFIGKIGVTDISQDSRPTYDVKVTGTATTNFFRTKYSVSYELQYQIPEDKNVIDIKTLFQAYSSNAALADNTYANQYLNVSGTITNIRSNSYSNTVEVELGIPTELFYIHFEFDANDTSVFNLHVGNQVQLSGYLNTGGSTYTLKFTDASIYVRDTSGSKPNPPSSSNVYPPTLAPIDPNDPNADIYSDHLGLYINEDGLVLSLSVGTGDGISYQAQIYANKSDADNYANPLLELTGGSMDYYSGAMVIDFSDFSGNCVYIERDNNIEDNYTFDMHGDSYFEGNNMEPYYRSTFYMIERFIDVMG